MSSPHSKAHHGKDDADSDEQQQQQQQTYHYDMVVVGAGPAGSSVALTAAQNKVSVAILEKEKTVAENVRTSGVTWMRDIREFGIPDDCFNPIKNFSFCSPNNSVTISDSVPRAAVLDVRKTYRWLAFRATQEGADLFVNTNIDDVIKDENGDITGVAGTGADGGSVVFYAKVVVDASGFASTVCRAMGFASQWKRFGAGAEYEVSAKNVDRDTWWLMVGKDYSPAGYAWIFPLDSHTVRIGVGVGKPESDIDPTQRLKELIHTKAGPIQSLGDITPIEFHYGLIPNDGTSRRTVFNNLVLVGDSAGQANPLVLEGIRYAIKFGRVAGKVASDAVLSGRTDRDALYPYEKQWRRAIGSKIDSAKRVQDRWITLSDTQWDRELDVIRELGIEEFLDFIRADFGLSRMISMAARHPMLAVRQLFGMIRPKNDGGHGRDDNNDPISSNHDENGRDGRS